jgi:hypothetical protein
MTTTTTSLMPLLAGDQPIDPADTAALFELWGRIFSADEAPGSIEDRFVSEHGGLFDVAAVMAVARAVCPEDYVVVPADDLAEAIETLIEAARGAEFDRIYTLVDDDARPRRERAITEAKAALLALLTGKEAACGV